ncbi:Negative regulator of flagellin synthesis FlgM [Castellaniella defragrans 65Phen]|uniref:Negative regulator of flagellin synthesis n=2 Tax=Castellaniella defragrans TaxID=75697 RepID=W8X9H4_CASD6|nr:flagellar biosynthesis anti-sigma factor FlgM [Castellaniella defragrans]KAB0609770.1 flagellar biosynthesis anti-sigma factor FlgM [Castellaniella defragrans]MBB6082407.1 negative regulator of flagellin synthesis FlgM [Castellaniella defragrans]CDM24830.1 Negative regulator of flagellin synthesis FlgM [Castellaniella defragrans 65Phen]
MKINSTSSNPLLNGVAGGTRNDTASPAAPSAAAGSRTAVDLSPAARHLAALNDSDADVQAERVQQIRDALASGELKIDPSRIADGLLASVRDLLK